MAQPVASAPSAEATPAAAWDGCRGLGRPILWVFSAQREHRTAVLMWKRRLLGGPTGFPVRLFAMGIKRRRVGQTFEESTFQFSFGGERTQSLPQGVRRSPGGSGGSVQRAPPGLGRGCASGPHPHPHQAAWLQACACCRVAGCRPGLWEVLWFVGGLARLRAAPPGSDATLSPPRPCGWRGNSIDVGGLPAVSGRPGTGLAGGPGGTLGVQGCQGCADPLAGLL